MLKEENYKLSRKISKLQTKNDLLYPDWNFSNWEEAYGKTDHEA